MPTSLERFGYGDVWCAPYTGRLDDPRTPEPEEVRVDLPLWMAQRIQWELEKSGSNYVNSLKSAIARARKENK